MPTAPATFCSEPGCPELVPGGRCLRHRNDASRNHHGVPRQARGLGAEFDRLKRIVIARDGGACQLRLPGCRRVATTANHRIPRSRGGRTTLENLEASCQPCNNRLGARRLVEVRR